MAKTITSQIPINSPSHTSTPEIKVPLPRGYPECQHRRHGSPWCLCDYPIARALVGRGLGPVVLPAVLVVAAPEPVPGSPLGLASWAPAMQTTPQSSSASGKGSAWCLCFLLCHTGLHARYTPGTRLLPALPSHLPFQPANCFGARTWAGTAEPRSTPEPQPEPERPAAPLSPDHDFSRFRRPHCARFGNLGIPIHLILMSS